ncbi:Gfo/Idh/MocA family protein [Gluconacetobacter diazotrophicus]|uniref:Gfo/Idh/MocA family protein n=1 Tax=Gluconacetobacter diazotrophicus TaxID=33996 RepID=UPI00119BC5E9|nr:Gfo/Idh/MocA family oxidoreductase [Gluconacetobacter diazotrophicus]TWB07763.1 putative dehydrogenase [Gluconacetobacter diazotrophicus]
MSILNVLLSGPGLIGRKHADLLANSPRCALKVIVAPRTARNMTFAQERGVALVETIDAALDRFPIDAAILASPNAFHCEQALMCLDRRIPTLVEKPLATNSREALMICEASERNSTPVLVGHHRTYSGLLPVAKKFICSPSFGQPVAVHGSALFYKPDDYFNDGPWRARIGGGPILINMIHEVGILQYLYGPICSVWAQASNERRGFEVEDTVIIGFKFENGALGTFILSDIAASNQSWEMTSGENPAYPYFDDANCYHFAGTLGSLDFPTFNVRTYSGNQTPSWWKKFDTHKLSALKTDPFEQQLHHFEDVVLGLDVPLMPASAGLSNIRVVESINISIKENKSVDVCR